MHHQNDNFIDDSMPYTNVEILNVTSLFTFYVTYAKSIAILLSFFVAYRTPSIVSPRPINEFSRGALTEKAA